MTPLTASGGGLAPVGRVLANGVRVIAQHSGVTPAVTIHCSVMAGSVCDPPAHAGLAHFLSRTIDRGTTTRSADQIAAVLDDRGVTLTVTVNRHALFLVCTCLVEDVADILALLADIVAHPVFPAEDVDTRRGEIVTLIRQDEDAPATMAVEGLLRLLYGEFHPYGRRPRGTVDDVRAIGREALARFHARRILPPAVSLVLVGDLPPAQGLDEAERAFGSWAAASAADAPVILAEPSGSGVRRTCLIPMPDKAQVDLAYGFTSIRRADPAYHAYALMNNVIGQYALGGRIGQRIREQDGMAYYAFSALDANVIPGPWLVRAGIAAGNVERAVAAIDDELARFAAEGATDRELTESRQYLTGSLPRTLETNAGIAGFLQTSEFFGLGLDYDRRLPALLAEVTLEDVHEAARRLLVPGRATIVVAGPWDGTLA